MPSHIDNSIARCKDLEETFPAWYLSLDPVTSLDSCFVSDDDLRDSLTLARAIDLADADHRHKQLIHQTMVHEMHKSRIIDLFNVFIWSLLVIFWLSLFFVR